MADFLGAASSSSSPSSSSSSHSTISPSSSCSGPTSIDGSICNHSLGSNNRTKTIKWQIGTDTDIGGGKENQDDCFVFTKIQHGICVLGVLDGHGREVGKVAAVAARKRLLEYFEDNYTQLLTSDAAAYECMVRAHEVAHEYVKQSFREELMKQSFEVRILFVFFPFIYYTIYTF